MSGYPVWVVSLAVTAAAVSAVLAWLALLDASGVAP